MILDLANEHTADDLIPFVKNGILIDTSVMKIFIDGFISARYTGVSDSNFECLQSFLSLIKLDNKWDKFIITPHILTEVCTHFRKDYSKWKNYAELAGDILPVIGAMQESDIAKVEIIKYIDKKRPVIEIGDISIFLTADNLTNVKDKVSILVNDREFNDKYRENPYVMIMDYNNIVLNLS